MSPQCVIRWATAPDGSQLAALDASSWPPEVVVVPARPADEPFFDDAHRPEDVLVAQLPDTGGIAGYARLGRHIAVPANEHVVHIHAVVVAASARGRGVGAALVDAAVTAAGQRGAAKVGLRTLSNNTAAIRLYERLGFAEEGRLRGELRRPDGSYADDVWMARWLRPPEPAAVS